MKDETMEAPSDELTKIDFEQVIADHGYAFKGNELQLVQISSGDPYKFNTQAEYEFMSHLVIKYVQQRMVKDF